jgi:protein TonB
MPKAISLPAPPYDQAEEKAGHGGKVQLRLRIGVDGKVREAGVEKSSGWPVLDAQAVATARTWTFSPALDATGAPMEAEVAVPVGFTPTSTAGPGGADPEAFAAAVREAEAMTCAAFVADVDARGLTGKERGAQGPAQYSTLVGIHFVAAMSGPNDAALAFVRKLPKIFPQTVAQCREQPARTLGEAFKLAVRATQ